ncbi:MAG: cyclopropane-fatty-acyl-phospholipid synthase family protein [Thiolinea sp.]
MHEIQYPCFVKHCFRHPCCRCQPLAGPAGQKLLHGKLQQLQHGQLIIEDGNEIQHYGHADHVCPLTVRLRVHRPQAYADVAFGGTIGSGEAYMDGDWDCDDLTGLIRILVCNRSVLNGLDAGSGKLLAPLHQAFHWLHRNTLGGSRRNIGAHYDLGNAMFEQFLDPTMMYSSAVFESADMPLEQASLAKLKRICDKLELGPDDHVLEIGTGWGGFALYAAQHYGCRVTTTTISQEQHDYAQQRIQEAGLTDRITLLCQDYRELQGQYDKLVSIEMIEAVGHRYFDTYFRRCSHLLKPEGMMLLQAITIDDRRYAVAKKEVDFIQRYIFPGGCLPSVEAIARTLTRATDLRIYHLDDIGPHYARTLRLWRERFQANWPKIRKLGYDERFARMWEFYLCYCEGGFEERAIGTVQVLLTKPLCRRAPVL